MDKASLEINFKNDLDSIAANLIRGYQLKFSQAVGNLSSPLLRWLDFTMRYVDQRPRQIALSDKFPKAGLPLSTQSALAQFIRRVETGQDLNPFQGRGLILRNDTSGSAQNARTDLLFADWSILHFHLSEKPIPAGQYFSAPADYLAFCLVGSNAVALIDVLPHPDRVGFSDPELMNTVARSWPQYVEKYRVKGAAGNEGVSRSAAEIDALRSAGANAFFWHKGNAYMSPSMGLTAAGIPLSTMWIFDNIQLCLGSLASMVCDPAGQFQQRCLVQGIRSPDFSLAASPEGLIVHEKTYNLGFLLPRSEGQDPANDLERLHGFVMPKWAMPSAPR
jgi:hypothetical protein